MRTAGKKLRSKDGVSIFMGLIFLLVCLMVGTVALTAATAAAGKLSRQREAEQDYLTVASAARLMKARICELTYRNVEVNSTETENVIESTVAAHASEIILKSELEMMCRESLVKKSDPLDQSFEISLKQPAGASAVKWKTVFGLLRMDKSGKIMVSLWLGDKDWSNDKNHNFIEMEFSPDGPVQSKTVTSKEDPAGSGNFTETKRVTTVCSWPETGCTIRKGK